jgi:hypothetical protein
MFQKLSQYLLTNILSTGNDNLQVTDINNLPFTTVNNTSIYIYRTLPYLLTSQILPSKHWPPTCWDMDTGDGDNRDPLQNGTGLPIFQ